VSENKLARGSATRTANMNKRRGHILACAGNIISNEGIGALTLNRLALDANLTVPTIHNLIGKKSDIFKELFEEMVAGVEDVLVHLGIGDTIAATEAFIDKLMELFSTNEGLYKGAFAAGEREKLFEHELPSGIYAKGLQVTIQVCTHAQEEGYLEGKVNSSVLAHELFGCQRLARHDWGHGYIDLKTYKTQVLIGMFIVFLADASPTLRSRLLTKIEILTADNTGGQGQLNLTS
jgi:AcrR family transcriptional regulator